MEILLKALFFISIIMIVVIAVLIFNIIANNYIIKNKNNLVDKSNPLYNKCKTNGVILLDNFDSFELCINAMSLNRIHKCSSSVVSNAQNDEIKYLIKYSNVENSIECVEGLDFCIDFLKKLSEFKWDMELLLEDIRNKLPVFVSVFASKKQIPYIVSNVDLRVEEMTNPTFVFLYVSPGGKSRREHRIEITNDLLIKLKGEISFKISKKENIKTQRNAMTNDLREAIKKRDNYTCCLCGNSVFSEPNLLLEVDHIIPVSKGGKTESSNLQTLCWKCNRAKSNK